MNDTINNKLLQLVNEADIKPVSVYSTVEQDRSKVIELVNKNALVLQTEDLLNLGTQETLNLTKNIRKLFERVALSNGVIVDEGNLAEFLSMDPNQNIIIHELSHLKVVSYLRPELVSKAHINILAVLYKGTLQIAMNIIYPKPEIAFTLIEEAKILLAPYHPSDSDYYDLFTCFDKRNIINIEEIEMIIALLELKSKSWGKEQLLEFCKQLKEG